MSYCSSCGAYIPEGQNKCVACGAFVVSESEKPFEGAAAAKQPGDSEKFRETLEEQRRRQKEENKKWAEKLKAERDAQKAHSTSQSTGGIPTADRPAQRATSNKLFAVLSYFSILCFLPFLFCPQDEFARFHGKQGVILLIFSIILDFVARALVGGFGWIFSLARLYLFIKGIINAADNKMEPLPFIGQYADKLPL